MKTNPDLSSLAEACAKAVLESATTAFTSSHGVEIKTFNEKTATAIVLAHLQPLAKDREGKDRALRFYAHADFLTTEQQQIADNALKAHAI